MTLNPTIKKTAAALLCALLLICALPLGTAHAANPVELATTLQVNSDPNKPSDFTVAASGYRGMNAVFYLALDCDAAYTRAYAGDSENPQIKCEMAIDVDPAVYPFAIENGANNIVKAERMTSLTTIPASGRYIEYFRFTVNVSSYAELKPYNIPLQVYYLTGPDTYSAPLSYPVYFTVNEYVPPPEPTPKVSSGGSGFKAQPRVIVTSYSFDKDVVYAGEGFSLKLSIQNMSDYEAVKNLTLDYQNAEGFILPGPDQSNTIFIGALEKGELRQLTVPLTVAPDATAKSQSVSIKLSYDGARSKAAYTMESSIAVPVQQRQRVRMSDPVIYDEAWVGGTVSVGLQMFNLGKSTLYNCMVLIEGDGLSLEESYFGGNVAAGGTMRADLTVLTEVPGEIRGNLIVSYENVYGVPTEEKLPFTLFVNDNMDMGVISGGLATDGDIPAASPMEGGGPGGGVGSIAWYWWAGAGAALLTGIILVGRAARKKRERELMEM